MEFDLQSSPAHTPIKCRCPIKKINWITLAYLTLESNTKETSNQGILLVKPYFGSQEFTRVWAQGMKKWSGVDVASHSSNYKQSPLNKILLLSPRNQSLSLGLIRTSKARLRNMFRIRSFVDPNSNLNPPPTWFLIKSWFFLQTKLSMIGEVSGACLETM